ncbi:YrhC-like protein [Bacillus oleivorans]|uniref:YrhC-like protein n=2 Tax=Bacillus oleivorans TaxID=1448271 RepID=A0A285CXU3_9BACI|nr:YrhC-like protein [Bacillus oleivorans]
MKNQMKILKGKVEDYQRFAYVLLAVSGFLYFGAVIPTIEKTEFGHVLLMAGTIFFITAATACLFYARHCKRCLHEIEEDQNV